MTDRRVQGREHLLVIAALAFAVACGGGSGTTAPVNTGGTPTVASVPYVGSFASATESGTLSFTLGASVSGSIVLLNGTTTALTGTYAASSGAVTLSGGAYNVSGTVANGTFNGSYGTATGSGTVTAQAQGATGVTSKTFCGTYVNGGDFGWLDLVVSPTGTVTGFAVSGVGLQSSVTITGTLAGTTLTATTNQAVAVNGALSTDGTSVTGTYLPAGSAQTSAGTFSAGTAKCGTAIGTSPSTSIAGAWATGAGASTVLNLVLTETGSVVDGTGAIHVAGPLGYTGDRFKILSGSFTSPTMTFTAQLGANPVGDGTFWYGTLSYTGALSNNTTATGTMIYTPPRTLTQIFTAQTVTGVSIGR